MPKSWLSRSRAWISLVLLSPIAILVGLSAPHVTAGSLQEIGFEAVAWALFVAGAMSRWWATLYIGGRKGDGLVCDGPYSVCRNPLYLGTFLIATSIPAMVQSATFALALVLVSWLYLTVTVRDEERRLLNRYGDEFVAYCNRVPMFFPRFHLYHSPESTDVRVEGLRAELMRSLRWVWVPLLCQVLIALRSQPWWPHCLHLP